jgi:hypothetical protein
MRLPRPDRTCNGRREPRQLDALVALWLTGGTEANYECDNESQMSGDKLSASWQLGGNRKVPQRLRETPGIVYYAVYNSDLGS